MGTGLHPNTGTNSVKAELYSSSSSDTPGTKPLRLHTASARSPVIPPRSTPTDSGLPQAPRTSRPTPTYWVVFKEANSGAASYDVTRVATGAENPGAASGWSIGDSTLRYVASAEHSKLGGRFSSSQPILARSLRIQRGDKQRLGSGRFHVAPQLQSATVDGYTLTLAYDEPLDEAAPPPLSAFTVKVGGSPGWIRSLVVDQSDVRVYVADPVGGGTVTVDYTVPTDEEAGRVRDTSGNAAASLSGQAATNNTTDQVAPLLQTATVNEHIVTLTYDETLDETVTPHSTAYTVKVGGDPHLASSVVVDQTVVRVHLADPVAMGDTVTVDYTVPTSVAFRVRDPAGNAVVSLTGQAVTNNTTSSGGGGSRSDEQDPPGVPEGLAVALQQSGKLKATWKAPGSGPAPTGYTVQWKAAVDAWEDPGVVSETDVTKTSYVIGGLTDGVEYAARVVATRDGADSDSLRGGHRHAAGDHASRAFVGRSGRRRADPHIQRSAGHGHDPSRVRLRGDRGGRQPGSGCRDGVRQRGHPHIW